MKYRKNHRIKGEGTNKREPPGILRCYKCAKYREGGDARRLKRRKRGKRAAIVRGRKPHGLRLELKIIYVKIIEIIYWRDGPKQEFSQVRCIELIYITII